MKSFVLFALLSLPNFAFAEIYSGPVTPLKAFDGKSLSCQEGSLGYHGYRTSVPSVRVLGAETLRLNFSLLSFACVYTAEKGYAFSPIALGAPWSKTDRKGNAVTVYTLQSEAVITNARFHLVNTQALQALPVQNVSMDLALDKILSFSERQALGFGEPVLVSLEFFNRSLLQFVRGTERFPEEVRTGGSFYFNFWIQNVGGSLQVSKVKAE